MRACEVKCPAGRLQSSQLLTSFHLKLTHGKTTRRMLWCRRQPYSEVKMKFKRRNFMGGFNRFRLMLTLGLAVLLPAAALIYVNFSQLRAIERDKGIEAIFNREFQEVLAITEKKINKKAFTMAE